MEISGGTQPQNGQQVVVDRSQTDKQQLQLKQQEEAKQASILEEKSKILTKKKQLASTARNIGYKEKNNIAYCLAQYKKAKSQQIYASANENKKVKYSQQLISSALALGNALNHAKGLLDSSMGDYDDILSKRMLDKGSEFSSRLGGGMTQIKNSVTHDIMRLSLQSKSKDGLYKEFGGMA